KLVTGVQTCALPIYQLASYCGRHLDPADLERRATMPDVVKALAAQTQGLVEESDFYPLPCAHPNCHMMAYLYRGGPKPVPISRRSEERRVGKERERP